MPLNCLGIEKKGPPVAPVTLPQFVFKAGDVQQDTAEDEQHRLMLKVIKRGRDCWERITEVETFPNWLAIGRALLIGRNYALKATGANAPMGLLYCKAF